MADEETVLDDTQVADDVNVIEDDGLLDETVTAPGTVAEVTAPGTTPEVTAAPEPTMEEIRAQLAALEAKYEPFKKVEEEFDGIAGLNPAMELTNLFRAEQFNPMEARTALQMLAPERYNDLLWDVIDTSLPMIIQDNKVRDGVLASDPEYQNYLRLKAAGEIPDFTIDKDDPAYAEKFRAQQLETENKAFKAQIEKGRIDQAQAVKRDIHAAYDQEQINYLKEQTKNFDWGPYAHFMPKVEADAMTAFNKDPRALAAFKNAQDYAVMAKDMNLTATQRAQAAIYRDSATGVVRNRLATHFKAQAEPYNKLISQVHKGRVTTRTKQENVKNIPGNSAEAAIRSNPVIPPDNDPFSDASALAKWEAAKRKGLVEGFK